MECRICIYYQVLCKEGILFRFVTSFFSGISLPSNFPTQLSSHTPLPLPCYSLKSADKHYFSSSFSFYFLPPRFPLQKRKRYFRGKKKPVSRMDRIGITGTELTILEIVSVFLVNCIRHPKLEAVALRDVYLI